MQHRGHCDPTRESMVATVNSLASSRHSATDASSHLLLLPSLQSEAQRSLAGTAGRDLGRLGRRTASERAHEDDNMAGQPHTRPLHCCSLTPSTCWHCVSGQRLTLPSIDITIITQLNNASKAKRIIESKRAKKKNNEKSARGRRGKT